MEINLDFTTYSNSGTKEISCEAVSMDCIHTGLKHHSNYTIGKLRNTYILEHSHYSSFIDKQTLAEQDIGLTIDRDIVTNPKHLEEIDWQLLRILNPQVSSVQWSIFKLLKDLVDAKTEEDYTIDQIKQILGE